MRDATKPVFSGLFCPSTLQVRVSANVNYIGLSCLNGHLDSFEIMPDTREAMAAVHAGLTMGIAMHAFGLDWKTALTMRDEMVRRMSTGWQRRDHRRGRDDTAQARRDWRPSVPD
jgi:hypothetical protein